MPQFRSLALIFKFFLYFLSTNCLPKSPYYIPDIFRLANHSTGSFIDKIKHYSGNSISLDRRKYDESGARYRIDAYFEAIDSLNKNINFNSHPIEYDHGPPFARRNKKLARMRRRVEMINYVYSFVPAFTDVFDEKTFYLTALGVTALSIFAAFVASRFIELKPAD